MKNKKQLSEEDKKFEILSFARSCREDILNIIKKNPGATIHQIFSCSELGFILFGFTLLLLIDDGIVILKKKGDAMTYSINQ
jgi:predicted transcriptional regulator